MIPTRVTEPHEEQATRNTPREGSGSVTGPSVSSSPAGIELDGVGAEGRPRMGLVSVPLDGLLVHRQPVERPFPQRVGTVGH